VRRPDRFSPRSTARGRPGSATSSCVRVVGHQPATDGSGLLDIDLEGHRRDDNNNRGGTVTPAVFSYRLIAWSAADGSRYEEKAARRVP